MGRLQFRTFLGYQNLRKRQSICFIFLNERVGVWMQVDYRGNEVTVESFLRVLLNRHDPLVRITIVADFVEHTVMRE